MGSIGIRNEPNGITSLEKRSEHWNHKQQDLALRVNSIDVIHFLMAILVPEAEMMINDPPLPTKEDQASKDLGQSNVNRSQSLTNPAKVNSMLFNKRRHSGGKY